MLEKVDEIFRACAKHSGQNKLFGGKIVSLFGHLYQLSSVQTCVTPRQVYNSPLWSKFIPFILMQNCCQKDVLFTEMLERIWTGDTTEDDILQLESKIYGKGHEMNEQCNYYFSPGVMVMCSKIDQRDAANRANMEKTLGQQKSYQLKSNDYDGGGKIVSIYESDEIDCQKGCSTQISGHQDWCEGQHYSQS